MKPFELLTQRGKNRRLRTLAYQAVQAYDPDINEIRLLGNFTNTLFKARSGNGEKFLLRACKSGWRTETDLYSEFIWLKYLTEESNIPVPCPKWTRDGMAWMDVPMMDSAQTQRFMLMSWMPGKSLEEQLTTENLEKMGKLFARLHRASLGFEAPAGFTTRRMSSIFARGEEVQLFLPEILQLLPVDHRAILEQTFQKVMDAYAQRYATRDGSRVIHHDLWHGNIKIFRGELSPLDFEDTVWGYPVQDIAMALQDLMTDVLPQDFELFLSAFRNGYETLEIWPEAYPGELDIFRAGRMLWVANYVACFEREYFAGYIGRVTNILERFLDTGILRR